jgi:regulator of RNase E activity RraA
VDLIERLLRIDVSALSDADKTLPVVDPGVRAMVPEVRMAGRAFTVLAENDHLPVMSALPRPRRATCSWSPRAVRRAPSSASCSRPRRAGGDWRGSSRTDSVATCGAAEHRAAVYARGTTPRSGTTVSRAALRAPILFGAVEVSAGRRRVR